MRYYEGGKRDFRLGLIKQAELDKKLVSTPKMVQLMPMNSMYIFSVWCGIYNA